MNVGAGMFVIVMDDLLITIKLPVYYLLYFSLTSILKQKESLFCALSCFFTLIGVLIKAYSFNIFPLYV
jgi:hypothetical protein